ncbi:MAG: hypothetical protein CMB51_02560 [Euryarchaeota archaeon]|nr:hypothetical protein [Euryarchaeota archaeon]
MTMVGTPLDLIPYVRGVQLILSGYSGYAKGKRMEVDQLVREEIIRAGGRVRSHMQNIHDTAFREDKLQETRAAKQCMEECDMLTNDVEKSVSGMEHAFFSGQRSPSNADLKKLIKHDHDVIDMITKAVNLANSAEHILATGEEDLLTVIRQTTQKMTSCRGFFGARNNVLNGLRKK